MRAAPHLPGTQKLRARRDCIPTPISDYPVPKWASKCERDFVGPAVLEDIAVHAQPDVDDDVLLIFSQALRTDRLGCPPTEGHGDLTTIGRHLICLRARCVGIPEEVGDERYKSDPHDYAQANE